MTPPPDPRSGHVALLGPMGAGKTTLGRALAEELGVEFADSDEAIAELTGGSGAEHAAVHGVPALHELERKLFLAALRAGRPTVIAAAASVVDDARVRGEMERHTCIWLDADDAVRTARRTEGGHRRPVTEGDSAELDERRRPYFEALSLARIDTTHTTVEEAVAAIVAALP
jgi:shikimate kinase